MRREGPLRIHRQGSRLKKACANAWRLRCFSHSNRTNDGIDIESSNVLVEDCDIDSGDDAVVFKTESDKLFPVTNVVVRNCRIASRCNGVKFGTGTEMERAYPECTMFHEGFPDHLVYSELALPAWGMYIRHADDIRFEKYDFSVDAPDARPPFATDDVNNVLAPSL